MPCERVNCWQSLTVMALRNQTRRVKQFLARFDKTQPFDPDVFVAFTSLPWFIRFSHNEGQDIPQVQDYPLLDPNEPLLSFDEISLSLMHPNQAGYYQVDPFYCIIFHCKTVNPDIITMTITSVSFIPLQIHGELWRVSESDGLDWDCAENIPTIPRPVSLISILGTSDNRSLLSQPINKQTSIDHSQQQSIRPITGSPTLTWDLLLLVGSNITRTMPKGICSERASLFPLHNQTVALGLGRTHFMIIAIDSGSHYSTWAFLSMSMHLLSNNGGRRITHHYHLSLASWVQMG